MKHFWESKHWEAEDKHLRELNLSPFKRRFPNLPTSPGLYIIRGPRQVGKSSWLKTILSNYSDPNRSFYFSCEEISDFKELSSFLYSIKDQKDLILLDEVSFVKEWWRSIKKLMDDGYRGRLILTGSHARELRKGADLMPGRTASGGEIELLPMTFDEYLLARKEANWRTLSRQESLEAFFRCGGFPKAVQESGEDGHVPQDAIEVYKKWLLGDILKLGKLEQYLRETLFQIALTCSTPISLQKLAQRTQMGSHHTALEYVNILEDCFALRSCFAIDPNTLGFRFRKEKKFYFSDPLIYHMAFHWAGTDTPNNYEEILAELVANESIYRESKVRNFRYGYLSTAKGEIDFSDGKNWCIEVKWSLSPTLSRAYKDALIPNKTVWAKDNLLMNLPWNRG